MILEIDNTELSFGLRKILYGIYLKAETGKVTGILGRNGCGKTCLLHILFGTLRAKYSHVRIDGIHQKKQLFKSNKAILLPQHRLLPSNISLRKTFDLFNADWSLFIEHFSSFEKYRGEKAANLSFGELRLLETYLVLSSGKDIILLDEPFSFIAPIYIEKIRELITVFKKNSIIIVTDHFYKDIIEVSDTVYFLKNGHSKQVHSLSALEDEGYLTANLSP